MARAHGLKRYVSLTEPGTACTFIVRSRVSLMVAFVDGLAQSDLFVWPTAWMSHASHPIVQPCENHKHGCPPPVARTGDWATLQPLWSAQLQPSLSEGHAPF